MEGKVYLSGHTHVVTTSVPKVSLRARGCVLNAFIWVVVGYTHILLLKINNFYADSSLYGPEWS